MLGDAHPYRLRNARSSDAPAIYALKRQAFGKRYLLYTIYQAPQSVHYLVQLIAEAGQGGSHDFIVLEHAEAVNGYYHAAHHGSQYFLNYIAIASERQNLGLGGMLLQHFETNGVAKDCQEFALDVFESNSSAIAWYDRHGYSPVASTFQVRLDMTALTGAGSPLLWDELAWSEALRHEYSRGFSKIDCTCGSGSVTLGLIAGHTCKLLAYHDVSFDEAILAAALRLKDQRRVIIVSGLPDLPPGLPILSTERAIRLSRTIG